MAGVTFREQTKFTILNGAEVAVVGWCWSGFTATAAQVKTAADANIGALWTGIRDVIHSTVNVSERELQTYDTSTGLLQDVISLNLPASTAGTLAGNALPPQLASVVSLRSATPGPKGRGRFYLPIGSTSILAADGLIPLVTRQDVIDNFKTYFNAVSAATGTPALVVWSRVHGVMAPVTRIQMGSVWDTQRRRRSSLPESRYTVTL
jgi:hypothetical protein